MAKYKSSILYDVHKWSYKDEIIPKGLLWKIKQDIFYFRGNDLYMCTLGNPIKVFEGDYIVQNTYSGVYDVYRAKDFEEFFELVED